jgi:FkbH-like protein
MTATATIPATGSSAAAAAALRADADRHAAAGETAAAAAALRLLWATDSSAAAASFIASRGERLRAGLALQPYRLAILRSFTVEPLVPFVRAGSFAAGLDVALHVSDFNAHAQEMLDPASSLYAFAPDAAILAVQTRDLAPELWHDAADVDRAGLDAIVDRAIADLRGWIAAFRAHSQAHLIVHNFEQPVAPAAGLLDVQTAGGQSEAIRRLNRELLAVAADHRGVYVLDYDALVARHGRAHWHDERKWLTVRLPIAAGHLRDLTFEWLRFLHPLSGRSAKVVAVDLDNTLWGGVIGEDGLDGIKLGADYPGAAFRDVQRALADLRRRGILLAVCSKNNPDEALEALRSHPGMLLRPDDFSAMRINWADKAQNLREIAAELNVGIDALAFVDDNPVERQHVRDALPEVHVVELPADAMQFARTIRESPVFERLTLSAEDQQRAAIYEAQRDRDRLQQSVASREDFLRSLDQEAEIAPATAATLPRIAQLTGKTNQFNLTTRRYSEEQIRDLVASGRAECFSMRVRDRFGDNGLVGVAIVRPGGEDGDVCEIDTLLMSCRVIGRTIETAFLSFLAERARRQGARWLRGWFLPTRKNAPAKDFYASHGFAPVEETADGTLWRLELADGAVPCPEWVRLRVPQESDR